MTESKKQRREIRHALQAEALKNQTLALRMSTTLKQQKAIAKVMVNRAIARGVLNVG